MPWQTAAPREVPAAAVPGTAEDRNVREWVQAGSVLRGSGRPPGRPRIATPSSGGSGRNKGHEQRPSPGTAEDRNAAQGDDLNHSLKAQRPSPGTAEDRNGDGVIQGINSSTGSGRPPGRPRIATRPRSSTTWAWRSQRPSPGTAEDRNRRQLAPAHGARRAAAVPRDGRGSQPAHRWRCRHHRLRQRPSPGTAKDRNALALNGPGLLDLGSGRPPGRPRIPTRHPVTGQRQVIRCSGRPPGRPRIATIRRRKMDVLGRAAAVPRDGRGPQLGPDTGREIGRAHV